MYRKSDQKEGALIADVLMKGLELFLNAVHIAYNGLSKAA